MAPPNRAPAFWTAFLALDTLCPLDPALSAAHLEIMSDPQVLIAGAGPTGLVLALWLARSGVNVRIVDKAATPAASSRALAVQARTLEFYRQLGLADEAVAAGLNFAAVNLWARGKRVARAQMGEIGLGLSPFPFVLTFPQDQHERLLVRRLEEAGVEVERPLELVGFEETEEGVKARLKRENGTEETCRAAFLAGCDGAHSTVRAAIGASFPGGTYSHTFYVADVRASGPVMDGELHVALDEADFVAVFPLKARGSARLIGVLRDEAQGGGEELGWDDVSGSVISRLGVEVGKVNWFSTYRVHHRVADRFRKGRAFLLGDAAHIHSPVGGQGMNTGIGDAVNLAWKLAAVLQRRADPRLLDTYDPERIAFAQQLVETTDRVFTLVTAPGALARRMRLDVAPKLFGSLTGSPRARRFIFGTVSQTRIAYRKSKLSHGAAGKTWGGDRLAWTGPGTGAGGGDNFTPLATLDWQVHVYGAASRELQDVCAARGLALREFPWREEFWKNGLMQDALYLVRPDGHVALADPNGRAAPLERYLDEWGIEPRPPTAPAPAKPVRRRSPRVAQPSARRSSALPPKR
jgi:2-polyprenyl-6-methoxyphenol hydroxylase-like FAD-dependent oxidoreductase